MKRVWLVVNKTYTYGKFNARERAIAYMQELRSLKINAEIQEISIANYEKMCYNNIK